MKSFIEFITEANARLGSPIDRKGRMTEPHHVIDHDTGVHVKTYPVGSSYHHAVKKLTPGNEKGRGGQTLYSDKGAERDKVGPYASVKEGFSDPDYPRHNIGDRVKRKNAYEPDDAWTIHKQHSSSQYTIKHNKSGKMKTEYGHNLVKESLAESHSVYKYHPGENRFDHVKDHADHQSALKQASRLNQSADDSHTYVVKKTPIRKK